MRRGAVLLTITVLVLALVPVALAGDGSEANYKDRFAEVSYSGSDGTIHWAQPWEEIDDDNSGPSAGAVLVDTDPLCVEDRCLHIASSLITLNQVGALRFADTSIFSSATISYHLGAALIETTGPLGEIVSNPFQPSSAFLKVEVTKNRGGSWSVIDQWPVLDLLDHSKTKVKSIDGYLSEGFGVRFLVDGLVGGRVLIDDVDIRGHLVPDSTTTTKPSTTSTSVPTTSTTKTQTTPSTTSSSGGAPSRDRSDATTSTTLQPSATTTTVRTSSEIDDPGSASPDDGGVPPGGMRHAEQGLQVGYGPGLFGDPDMPRPEVLGLSVDYRMAVEVVSSSWLGLVALVLLITAALVHGLERRTRRDRG